MDVSVHTLELLQGGAKISPNRPFSPLNPPSDFVRLNSAVVWKDRLMDWLRRWPWTRARAADYRQKPSACQSHRSASVCCLGIYSFLRDELLVSAWRLGLCKDVIWPNCFQRKSAARILHVTSAASCVWDMSQVQTAALIIPSLSGNRAELQGARGGGHTCRCYVMT